MTIHPPLRLRVMSFNLRNDVREQDRNHLEETARLIEGWSPDLVGLQDVYRWLHRSAQPSVGLDELLGFEVAFERCSGSLTNARGLALASRINPDLVHEVELPGGHEPSRAQDARFSLNGHFVHLVNARFARSQRQRRSQAEKLAARLARYRRPVILVGDINASSDSDEGQILNQAGFLPVGVADLQNDASTGIECCSTSVMVSRHFRVEEVHTLRTRAGECRPVVATLMLTDPHAGTVAP